MKTTKNKATAKLKFGIIFIVETPVKATDLIVIPLNTKIYYLGNMKLNLITVPTWSSENEVHIMDINGI